MSLSKPTKINRLLKEWPKGTVATSRWLEKQGVRFDLAERYRRTGWLRSVATKSSPTVALLAWLAS